MSFPAAGRHNPSRLRMPNLGPGATYSTFPTAPPSAHGPAAAPQVPQAPTYQNQNDDKVSHTPATPCFGHLIAWSEQC